MALIYDANGLVIGDDGQPDMGWDSNALDPAVGLPPAQVGASDVGYFQQKINDFQNVLNAVDATSYEISALQSLGISQEDYMSLQTLQDEYASRKAAFKFAAEAFNGIAAMVNGAGGSMQSLVIPSGLGFAPLVIPVAWGLAIAGAAVLVSFGVGWMVRANTAVETASARLRAAAANSSDPTEIKRLLNAADSADIASANIAVQQQSSGGTIGQIANMVKYVALAAGAYLIFQLMQDTKRRK